MTLIDVYAYIDTKLPKTNMTEINRNPLDIGYIVYKIGTSEAYAQARNDAEILELDDISRRKASLRMAATALKGERASGYLTPEGHAFNITAHLTTFSDDYEVLDQLKASRASNKEKIPYLRRISEFNEAIKDMVDMNPALKFDEVILFLRAMDQKINGSENAALFEQKIKMHLNGMRHEIAVEQQLGCLLDVDYEEGSVEDDLNGADFFVSIDDSEMTPIDIKASRKTAFDKKSQALENNNDPNAIIWSQVSSHDFNGGFRISNDLAKEKAPYLHAEILKAIRSHTSKQKHTA